MEKSNLIIFITPTIVNVNALNDITAKKKNEMDKSKEEMDGKKKSEK